MTRLLRPFPPAPAVGLPAVLVAAILLSGLRPAQAQDEQEQADTETLLKLEEMQVPDARTLLSERPVDWVVLKSEQRVIVVEPVYPRPDTLQKLAQQNQRSLDLVVPDVGEVEYQLRLTQIERIIYHEELMLQRVDLLLKDGNIRQAFDLLLVVDRRMPNWDAAVPRHQQLLFREAQLLETPQPETALMRLEDAEALAPGVPGISELFGRIIDKIVGAAVAEKDYRRAQHFLTRTSETYRDHPIRQKWLTRLLELSDEQLQLARTAFEAGDFTEATARAQRANEIWLVSGNRRSLYTQILSRYQQLHVAVMDTAGEFPVRTDADLRHQSLTEATLFEPERSDSVTYYGTDFFEQWEPLDLGRRVVFRLRQKQPYWSSIPDVTAPVIIDAIRNRLTPGSPTYNERFASYIDAYLVRSPYEFEVRFSRIPLRVESLFSFPLTDRNGKLLSKRFRPKETEETENETAFERALPEPDGLANSQYHVAEIIEHKYEHSHLAVQAMLRGEVQMIAHLQPWEITAFEGNQDFFLRKYALPFVHVIQFNPETAVLRRSQVRRALSQSIDRERILERAILRDAPSRYGRVVAAPWPSTSYANSSLVELPEYSLSRLRAAAALRSTAELQLDEADKKPVGSDKPKAEETDEEAEPQRTALPTLRLMLEDDPLIRAGAKEVVKFWTQIGFNVEIVEPSSDPADWDMVYRKIRMVEPLLDLWPFLTLREEAEVSALLPLPDWLKQEIIDLDFVGNFNAAEEHMRMLHRHLGEQGFFIPLWEVDDYAVFSTSMGGFADEPVTTYQDVAGWTIQPNPGR